MNCLQYSYFKIRLYLATLSERQGAPDLICPAFMPTTKSAMKVSSVSPDRCETITFHPADCAR